MLQLFAYGTLPQLSSALRPTFYRALIERGQTAGLNHFVLTGVGQGVKLTEQQTTKLRQLTVVSLAGQTKVSCICITRACIMDGHHKSK